MTRARAIHATAARNGWPAQASGAASGPPAAEIPTLAHEGSYRPRQAPPAAQHPRFAADKAPAARGSYSLSRAQKRPVQPVGRVAESQAPQTQDLSERAAKNQASASRFPNAVSRPLCPAARLTAKAPSAP